MPPASLATARTWRTSSARLQGSPWMQMSLDTRVENLYHRVGALQISECDASGASLRRTGEPGMVEGASPRGESRRIEGRGRTGRAVTLAVRAI